MTEKEKKLKVLIISNDYELVKKITKTLFEKECYEIAENPYIAIASGNVRNGACIKPDILFLCTIIINTETDKKIVEFRSRFPDTGILLITDYNQLHDLDELCKTGADGFLFRDELEKIHDAVSTIVMGRRYMNQCLMDCLLQKMISADIDPGSGYPDERCAGNNDLSLFSIEEQQVYKLMMEGYSNEVIASLLGLNTEKVIMYTNHLNRKNSEFQSYNPQ